MHDHWFLILLRLVCSHTKIMTHSKTAEEEDEYDTDDFESSGDSTSASERVTNRGGGGGGGAAAAASAAAAVVADENNSSNNNNSTNSNSSKRGGWRHIDFEELEVGERIADGGVGVVQQGYWRGESVALKTLFDVRVSESLKQEYMNELLVMSELQHPNIVTLLGACMNPPNLCFVMELCETSLFELLHRNRNTTNNNSSSRSNRRWDKSSFSAYEKVQMARDVAAGVAYLHSLTPAIIHRDIKSLNLLRAYDGAIKLCDFGLVKTQHTTAGTPAYMAPELLQNQTFNRSVDVYAVGVVICEIFSEEIPFEGIDAVGVRKMVCAGESMCVIVILILIVLLMLLAFVMYVICTVVFAHGDHAFVHSFTHSFTHSLIHSFTHSLTHSLIHSFTCTTGERPRIPTLDCPTAVRDMIDCCWSESASERPTAAHVLVVLQQLCEQLPKQTGLELVDDDGDALDDLLSNNNNNNSNSNSSNNINFCKCK